MADSAVAITAGAGTNVDTRTEATNGNHRQVIVVGDPSTNAGVAPVDATKGLAVDLTATGANTNAIKVNVASGGVASGAIASGAVASGAVASGAVASGAFASGALAAGSIASGAIADYGVEDAAAAANPIGPMMMAVRRDTLATNEVSADGDNIALKATNKGKLHVAAEVRLGDTVADTGSGTGGSATQRIIIDSSQLGSLGQAAAASSAPVVMASDRQNSVAFSVVMSTDTGAYASGDLIADTQILNGFFNKTDGKGVVNSITIVEKDAQGAAYYILFHQTSTSMGTENSAPNISDANATAGIIGIVAVATTDFVTVSGTKVACIRNIGLPVSAASGTDDLYVSILNSTGTPTYASGEIQLYIGGLLD